MEDITGHYRRTTTERDSSVGMSVFWPTPRTCFWPHIFCQTHNPQKSWDTFLCSFKTNTWSLKDELSKYQPSSSIHPCGKMKCLCCLQSHCLVTLLATLDLPLESAALRVGYNIMQGLHIYVHLYMLNLLLFLHYHSELLFFGWFFLPLLLP